MGGCLHLAAALAVLTIAVAAVDSDASGSGNKTGSMLNVLAHRFVPIESVSSRGILLVLPCPVPKCWLYWL